MCCAHAVQTRFLSITVLCANDRSRPRQRQWLLTTTLYFSCLGWALILIFSILIFSLAQCFWWPATHHDRVLSAITQQVKQLLFRLQVSGFFGVHAIALPMVEAGQQYIRKQSRVLDEAHTKYVAQCGVWRRGALCAEFFR